MKCVFSSIFPAGSACNRVPTEEEYEFIERLPAAINELTTSEQNASTYVAGYLIGKDPELPNEGDVIGGNGDYLDEVNRGSLVTPRQNVVCLVELSLAWVKKCEDVKCQKQVSLAICDIGSYFGVETTQKTCMRLANVLLNGMQKADWDQSAASERRGPKYSGDEPKTGSSGSVKVRRISGKNC
jgi:hypothetical protein